MRNANLGKISDLYNCWAELISLRVAVYRVSCYHRSELGSGLTDMTSGCYITVHCPSSGYWTYGKSYMSYECESVYKINKNTISSHSVLECLFS